MKAGNTTYQKTSQIDEVIPVFPLAGALLLPGGVMPLNIFEPRYRKMVEDSITTNKLIGMIQPCLKGTQKQDGSPELSKTGCVGRLTAFQETGDGRYLITLAGVCRFSMLEEVNANTPYRQCRIEPFAEDLGDMENANDVDREVLLKAFRKYLDAHDAEADWDVILQTDTETLVNALCMMSPFEPAEKQAFLEAGSLKDRADMLIAMSEFHLANLGDDRPDKLN